MKISILHPSYGRPEQAFSTAITWLSRCVNTLQYIICISEADPLLNHYLRRFKEPFEVLTVPYANMVKQVNFAAKFAKNADILVCIADDFECPQNWDFLLYNALVGKKDFIVKTQDGIQKEIITLPIMDKVYYKRFNYIYNPAYNHYYGDEELYEVGKKLGKLITLPILFEHLHYTAGKADKDEVNTKNNLHFASDKATFLRRKRTGFP